MTDPQATVFVDPQKISVSGSGGFVAVSGATET